MKILKNLKGLISSIDMFYSSQMLRYDNDTQYKTFTGGIITTAIIVMVIISFFAMISDTLNRTAITSALTVIKNQNPPKYDLILDQAHNFMFGLQIQSLDSLFTLNLSQDIRYFDVIMMTQQFQYGVYTSETMHPLVQCTDQNWKMMPEIVEKSSEYGYSGWLCPQIGQTLTIQGSYTSQINLITFIMVNPCNNLTDPTHPCAPQQQIDQLLNTYENFYMSIFYINPVINPTKTDDISYFLEGQDYIIFSRTQGSQAWIEFSDYEITTDYSILPFSQYQTKVGAIVQNKAINHPFTTSNVSGFANFYFSKSSNSLKYQREVQKISAVFSYIGGLIGALTAVLFLMKTYTDTSLELTIAMALFKEPQAQYDQRQEKNDQKLAQKIQKAQDYVPLQKQSFNFKSFIKLMAYKLLSPFAFTKNWKNAKMLYQFRKEIMKQLDIKTLLRRLISIQSCMDILLDEDQLESLKYRKNVDLYKARQLRQLLVPNNYGDMDSKTQNFLNNKVLNQNAGDGKVDTQLIQSPQMFQQFGGDEKERKNKYMLDQYFHSYQGSSSEQSSEQSIVNGKSKNKPQFHLIKLRENTFMTDVNEKNYKDLKNNNKKTQECKQGNINLQALGPQNYQFVKKTAKKSKKKQNVHFEDVE